MDATRNVQPLKASVWGALLVLLLILSPTWSMAHSMYVFAYIDGGLIKGEGAYGDGGPASGAAIEIHDSDGLLIGQTNASADGTFSLPLKKGRPPFMVEIRDGGGHASTSTFGQEQSPKPKPSAAKSDQPRPSEPDRAATAASHALRDEWVRMLRDELAPIKAQLARLSSRNTIGLAEVVGGLGWIVGLAGLALWFKSRKR